MGLYFFLCGGNGLLHFYYFFVLPGKCLVIMRLLKEGLLMWEIIQHIGNTTKQKKTTKKRQLGIFHVELHDQFLLIYSVPYNMYCQFCEARKTYVMR